MGKIVIDPRILVSYGVTQDEAVGVCVKLVDLGRTLLLGAVFVVVAILAPVGLVAGLGMILWTALRLVWLTVRRYRAVRFAVLCRSGAIPEVWGNEPGCSQDPSRCPLGAVGGGDS